MENTSTSESGIPEAPRKEAIENRVDDGVEVSEQIDADSNRPMRKADRALPSYESESLEHCVALVRRPAHQIDQHHRKQHSHHLHLRYSFSVYLCDNLSVIS